MTHDMTGTMTGAADTRDGAAGLVDEFRAFAQDIRDRLRRQDERMTRLDRKHLHVPARPRLAASGELETPHRKAFDAYLRSGDETGLRTLELEGKALNTAGGGDGGFLVTPQTAEGIETVLRSTASLRSVARVVQIDAGSFDLVVDQGEFSATWVTETDPAAETNTGSLQKISIGLHEQAAMPKVSQRLLDDVAFDLESWLAGQIGEKFARAEAAAFVIGNGAGKPRGFLDFPKVAESAWSWNNIGYIAGGTAGSLVSADPLVDLVHTLGAAYRARATWVMNSRTAGHLRKMKDNDGRYLWSDGLAAGEPARLFGYPVLLAEDMPDIDADAFPVAFGDFGSGYTIVERGDLRILRDPFSAKPNVLFYATRRVGGAVTDFSAIKLLRIAVG